MASGLACAGCVDGACALGAGSSACVCACVFVVGEGGVVFVLGASPLEHAEVTNAARLATRRRFMRRG